MPNKQISAANIPEVYADLSGDRSVQAFIEYPMFVGDHFNLLYFGQLWHGKRVIGGYTTKLPLSPDVPEDRVYGNMVVGHVLTRVPDKSKLQFRNLVDVMDLKALKGSGADYLVLHRHPSAEWFVPQMKGTDAIIMNIWRRLQKEFGPAYYTDERIVVFALGKAVDAQ